MKNFIRTVLANETIKSPNSRINEILVTLSDETIMDFLSADGFKIVELEQQKRAQAKKEEEERAQAKKEETTKDILSEFQNLSGAKFVGFEYRNKRNELSNYTILSNISYSNWIDKKILVLDSLNTADFNDIATAHKDERVTADLVAQAAEKLLSSLLNNKTKETASNQSKAQSDTYHNLGGGVRQHKETEKYYAYGFLIKKTVIEIGEAKKKVNSKPLTLAQNAIEKHCNFSVFVSLEIEKPETVVNITGGTYQAG